jgi:hypothetical protein
MSHHWTRRQWLATTSTAVAGNCLVASVPVHAVEAPTAPVAIARCQRYGPELLPTMERMFDQLVGIERLVKGKTVAVKLNLTGSPGYRLGYLPVGLAQWVHPNVVGTLVHLLGKAGAHRIRLLESPWSTAEPLEEYMLQANW